MANTLFARLLLAFLLLSPFPLGALAWLHVSAFEQSLRETTLESLENIANKKLDQINAYLDERMANSRFLIRSSMLRKALTSLSHPETTKAPKTPEFRQQQAYFRSYYQDMLPDFGYSNLLLVDAAGNLIFSVREQRLAGTNLYQAPFANTPLATALREAMKLLSPQISTAHTLAPADGKAAIFIAAPIIQAGRVLGSVALQLDMNRLNRVTSDATGLGKSGETVLAQREGDMLRYLVPLLRIPDAAFHHLVPVEKSAPPMHKAIDGQHGKGVTQDYVGIEVVAAWRYIPGLYSGMVVKIDTAEAFASAQRLHRTMLMMLGLLLLVTSTAAWLFGRSLTRPIRQLSAAAACIASGELHHRASIDGCEEFRHLAQSFNDMADHLAHEPIVLEQRVAERTRQLQESEERFYQIFENMSSGCVLYEALDDGEDFLIQDVNAAVERIENKQRDELIGWRVQKIFPGIVDMGLLAVFQRVWHSGRPENSAMRFYDDGRISGWRENFVYRLSSGELVVIYDDVTIQKQTEENLRLAKQAAEAASHAKSEFLANMSHEIRTPMNAIIGLTQLVLDDETRPHQRDFLDKVLSSSRTLLSLLNDILDYSKIEAGHLQIEQIPLHPREVLENATGLFAAQIKAKGLRLSLDISPNVPDVVLGDPLRLSQVLHNLLSNAVKFTDHGAIHLSLAVLKTTSRTMTLACTLRDTGIGLTPEESENLFQPFMQADGSITRKYGGTGLGLAISRQLVNLMGGEISLSSQKGVGTCVTFTVSIAPAQAGAAPPDESGYPAVARHDPSLEEAASTLAGLRVLLAEDNPINQEVALEFMKRRGLQVIVVSQGDQALETLRTMGCESFDALLMDLHMPVMDGLEATRLIRALPGCKTLPIIAMTAAVQQEDRNNCAAAGMVDFISKPVNPQDLIRTLLKWTRPAQSRAAVAADDKKGRNTPATAFVAQPDTLPGHDRSSSELPGFELPEVLQRLGGDQAVLRRLLHRFAEDYGDFSAQLDSLVQADDKTQAAALLHGLKGVAANLSAKPLAQATQVLEQEIRGGTRPDSRSAFEAQLQAALASVNRYLAAPAVTPAPRPHQPTP